MLKVLGVLVVGIAAVGFIPFALLLVLLLWPAIKLDESGPLGRRVARPFWLAGFVVTVLGVLTVTTAITWVAVVMILDPEARSRWYGLGVILGGFVFFLTVRRGVVPLVGTLSSRAENGFIRLGMSEKHAATAATWFGVLLFFAIVLIVTITRKLPDGLVP